MAGLQIKRLNEPDETRPFAGKGRLDILKLEDASVGCATFEPGWRWSENVKPLASSESCEIAHIGYCIAGRMHIAMDDGEERDIVAGDVFTILPGHHAWVVGNQTCVMLDFSGYDHYAERRTLSAQEPQSPVHIC